MTVTLSGGPLSGVEVDGSDWPIGARRYFVNSEGQEITYWRYDDKVAVFEGIGRIE